MQSRFQRSVSSQASSRIQNSVQLQINIQQPMMRNKSSQMSSSIHENKSELSIHDKINMLNESIRTSEKNERMFQQNMVLREKLHQTEEQLQDAVIKCSLWDKFKLTIEGLNKDYLQLKSIENNCSDGTVLKEFLSVLREKLQKVSISQRAEKSHSVESKKKDTEYYELYEKEKRQNFEYQQHIITLNNELDMLEEENQKLKEKLKSSSLQSSGVIGSDGAVLSGSQKKIYQELTAVKEQNTYLLEHKNTLQGQLDAEREKLKEIVESLDQYESEIKRNELELKRKNKEMEAEIQAFKDIQKTLKSQLQETLSQNALLKQQCQRLSSTLSNPPHNANFPVPTSNSQQYLEPMSQYQALYQKYQKVKTQNQVLGEQKQKLGQQMQEIELLSKQMEYNYEVKIDDLRKHYEGQMETIMNKFNQKILAVSQERSQTLISAEKQRNQLTQKLQKLQRSTSSQDSDKELLVNRYEKTLIELKEQITRYKKETSDNQLIISELKQQIYELTSQRQQSKQSTQNANRLNEIQQTYKTKISILQRQGSQMIKNNQELTQQVQTLRQHIESITAELNEQDQSIQQFKNQLIKKDQLIMSLSNQEKEQQSENQQVKKQGETNSQRVKQLEQDIDGLRKVNQQLKKAFMQNEENNTILKKNISQWQAKYTSLSIDHKTLLTKNDSLKSQIQIFQQIQHQSNSLQLKNNQLSQQIAHLTSQLQYLKQQQRPQTQTTINPLTQQSQPVQIMQNMDGLMVESLKQQIETLLEENRTIEDENNRYRQQINESQQQVQEIQRYVKLISVQNKKIPHYEQQLLKQRIKSEKLKLKITEQKDKFMAIMEKNQQVYEQLVKKSERNELIFKENIRVQKEQTEKLQYLINKYYSTFMHTNLHPEDNIQQV